MKSETVEPLKAHVMQRWVCPRVLCKSVFCIPKGDKVECPKCGWELKYRLNVEKAQA